MSNEVKSNEEIVQALVAKVTAAGVDSWKVKVWRRKAIGGPKMFVATFEQATVEHVANAESWLGVLGGGGPQFLVDAFHVADPSTSVGGSLIFNIDGEPHNVDPLIARSPAWRGPKKMISPEAPATAGADASGGYHFQSPVGGAPAGSAAGIPAPGGLPHQPGISVALDPGIQAVLAELKAEKRELQELKRRTELEALERKTQEAERRAQDREQALLKELEDIKRRASEPKPETRSALSELMAVLTPLVSKFMDAQATAAQRQAEIQREIQAQNLAAQREMQAQTQAMLTAISNKPAIDPMYEKLMDRIDKQKANDNSAITQSTEAIARMATLTMRMAAHAADMNQPEVENPAIQILGEVRKGFEALANGVRASNPPPPPRVIQQTVQVPVGATPEQVEAVKREAAQRAQAQAAAAAAPKQRPGPNAPLVDRLVDRVEHLDDVSGIARDFVAGIGNDESLEAALEAVGGDEVELFRRRLGEDWGIRNQTYALSLFSAFKAEVGRHPEIFQDDGDIAEGEVIVTPPPAAKVGARP